MYSFNVILHPILYHILDSTLINHCYLFLINNKIKLQNLPFVGNINQFYLFRFLHSSEIFKMINLLELHVAILKRGPCHRLIRDRIIYHQPWKKIMSKYCSMQKLKMIYSTSNKGKQLENPCQ